MTFFRTILITMAAVAAFVVAAAEPAMAARGGGDCWSNQQIQTEIASGQIQSWSRIRKLAGIPPDYHETSDTPVCIRGGAPHYVVNMASPKGEQFKYVLNAVDGSS